MVSRVYTPLIPSYQRSQGVGNPRGAVTSATDEQQRLSAQQSPIGDEGNDSNRPSAGLQAVQFDRFQKIPLDAVIHDFKSTMTALGADEKTRSEVAAYLNVVRLQAAKEQPEVPFIKHTLRTAANSLDQFISNALGQPSKVVKEWVDALLLQDIDYHADLPPEAVSAATNAEANSPASEKQQAEAEALSQEAGMATSTKAQLKSLIEDAKACQKSGQTTEAEQKLQDALALLADRNKPAWEGKVWQLKGRFYDQNGRWEEAIASFKQAADKFETANLPQKQATALHTLGSILEDHGNLDQARQAYEQVVSLDMQFGDIKAQLRSLNDLGSIYLRQGDAGQATQTLQQAAQLIQTHPVSAQVQSDILSNLASAQRQAKAFPDAIQNYQQALKAAREGKDRSRYTSTLQQLASLYVEANQPDQAMKALQRLKSMQPS